MQIAAHKGIGGIDKKAAQEMIHKTPKKKRSMFARGDKERKDK